MVVVAYLCFSHSPLTASTVVNFIHRPVIIAICDVWLIVHLDNIKGFGRFVEIFKNSLSLLKNKDKTSSPVMHIERLTSSHYSQQEYHLCRSALISHLRLS